MFVKQLIPLSSILSGVHGRVYFFLFLTWTTEIQTKNCYEQTIFTHAKLYVIKIIKPTIRNVSFELGPGIA